MGNEQDEKLDFNALVEQCAGTDSGIQESCLAKVVMKAMINRYGKGKVIPDSLGLPKIEDFARKDVKTSCGILDAIYSCVAKSFYGDSCHMLDIRSEAIKYMQAELEVRQKIKRDANI